MCEKVYERTKSKPVVPIKNVNMPTIIIRGLSDWLGEDMVESSLNVKSWWKPEYLCVNETKLAVSDGAV